jgi:TM2 domain-containing membrane protein YozV
MMSAGLVALVGGIYAYIAAEQFYLDNPAMGICYAGYAFSNVGLWWFVK